MIGAGLAIGLALQGTLTNLAAGIMLLLFRPFRVGDLVETAAVTGEVRAVSLFHTELMTIDHVHVIAPNSVLWGVPLKNNSFYPQRRLNFIVPVPFSADAGLAVQTIRTIVQADKRVAADPPPSIAMARFNSTDKVTEIEVHVWADQSAHDILRADLLAAVWAAILKP